MVSHNKPSLSPSRTRRPRWECESVELVASPVDSKEWQYTLETLAEALYPLSHQLQEVDPVIQTGLNENTLPHSLLHPDETLTPATAVVGEDGVWNGKEPNQLAA